MIARFDVACPKRIADAFCDLQQHSRDWLFIPVLFLAPPSLRLVDLIAIFVYRPAGGAGTFGWAVNEPHRACLGGSLSDSYHATPTNALSRSVRTSASRRCGQIEKATGGREMSVAVRQRSTEASSGGGEEPELAVQTSECRVSARQSCTAPEDGTGKTSLSYLPGFPVPVPSTSVKR